MVPKSIPHNPHRVGGSKGRLRVATVTLLRRQTPGLPKEVPFALVQIRMMRDIAGGLGLAAAGQFGCASVDCGDPATARALLEISFLGRLTRNNRSVRGLEQVVECPSLSRGPLTVRSGSLPDGPSRGPW